MKNTVYFRAFEMDDASLIYKWLNDDDLKKMTVGVNRRICHEEAADWVKKRMYDRRDEVWWAICDMETGKMIGYASLVNIHYINSSAETGAIVIGDLDYNDGFAWIETVLFMFEYAFERLGLNRLYGQSLLGHKISNFVEGLMFMQREGILRQAVYKNGRFYDISYAAILKEEYFAHQKAGEYELTEVLHRLKQIRRK